MSIRGHLRQRNHQQLMLTQLASRYSGGKVTHPSPEGRYLTLQLNNEKDQTALAWLDVDNWLEVMLLHLPEMPWHDVPLDYLARWLGHLELNFLYQNTIWQVVQITPASSGIPKSVLTLPSEPTPLLCLEWPESAEEVIQHQQISPSQIPFRMQFVLGYTSLTLAQLVDVAPGDLLLIKRSFACLIVGKRKLFQLRYSKNQEVIVEGSITESGEVFREEDEFLPDLASLPVDIEFVLGGRTVSLRDLESIGPGTALALDADAERNIKIYLNKALFARGELVALDTGGLAVEVNHVNSGLIGKMDASDVE